MSDIWGQTRWDELLTTDYNLIQDDGLLKEIFFTDDDDYVIKLNSVTYRTNVRVLIDKDFF